MNPYNHDSQYDNDREETMETCPDSKGDPAFDQSAHYAYDTRFSSSKIQLKQDSAQGRLVVTKSK